MKNFWQKLPKPFFVQAPMADGTDFVFRQMIVAEGKPDVMWTEFVSADGLCHDVAREKLLWDLYFTENERPIVAQLFTGKPEKMEQAARIVQELGFDGIDINMGCPDRAVEKQGAGASLIKDVRRACELIRAAKRGAPNIPISVKTRIGYNTIQTKEWGEALLDEDIAALTVHLRTRKEMSKVPAHWEQLSELREKADQKGTLLIGNGDVYSLADGRTKAKRYGADGVMIGRGLFGNPWVFSKKVDVPFDERLDALLRHATLYSTHHGERKHFLIMRKHMGAYIKGFPHCSVLRQQLMETHDTDEVKEVLRKYKKSATGAAQDIVEG